LCKQAERKVSLSTLKPDAGNAAVGSHTDDFLQEASQKAVSCFYFTTENAGGACIDRLRGRTHLRPLVKYDQKVFLIIVY